MTTAPEKAETFLVLHLKEESNHAAGHWVSMVLAGDSVERHSVCYRLRSSRKRKNRTGTRMSDFPPPLNKGRCRQDLLRFLSRQLPLDISSENLHLVLWNDGTNFFHLCWKRHSVTTRVSEMLFLTFEEDFSHFMKSFILKHPRGGFLIRIPCFPSNGFS